MNQVVLLVAYLLFCYFSALFLFAKYRFFRKARGFLVAVAAGFLAIAAHNFVYALFLRKPGGDEPVSFILALLLLAVGFWIFYFWLMRKVLWESKLRQKFGIKEKECWTVSVAAGLSLIIIVVGIFSLNSWQRLQGVQKQYWWVGAVGGAEQLNEESSFYCFDRGGILEARKSNGAYRRFCVFKDRSECGVEDFYLRKCEPGDKFCQDSCGDGECQELVCQAAGCPCAETPKTCPEDCPSDSSH